MNLQVTDTIVCDTTQLNGFINNGSYDYNSELVVEKESLLEKFFRLIKDWYNDLFDGVDAVANGARYNSAIMMIIILVVVFLIIGALFIMYKKKMFFFRKGKKDAKDYEVVEESIYGVDFVDEISAALKRGNYNEAVRLKYLQCLRLLSDNEQIAWRIYKTPVEYTQEYKDDIFAQLTREYVLVRYGGYVASSETFDEISEKYRIIDKHVSEITQLSHQLQEGDGNEN